MGVTIVQKSDLKKKKKNPTFALVLAGGAISGGAFKLGGLMALDDFLVNKKVNEFDMYVGLSAGAFIGAFLAGGLTPVELVKAMEGRCKRLTPLKPLDFYWPAYKEWIRRGKFLIKDLLFVWPSILKTLIEFYPTHDTQIKAAFNRFMKNPTYHNFEEVLSPLIEEVVAATPIPHPGKYIPSGVFDNSKLEEYVRKNLENNDIPNNFKKLKRERGVDLYITATNLNTAQTAIFGHDFDSTLSISEAVQASSAVPGFYIPARLKGEEYLDGGLRKTANVSLAMLKGADLIIVYNPFRPFMNRSRYQLGPNSPHISDYGMGMVINQTFRTMLQSRLHQGLERIRLDPHFKGDLILIEPTETDVQFFNMNPLAFWTRSEALKHGYVTVKRSLQNNIREIQEILASYGIVCNLDYLEETTEHFYDEERESIPYLRVVK